MGHRVRGQHYSAGAAALVVGLVLSVSSGLAFAQTTIDLLDKSRKADTPLQLLSSGGAANLGIGNSGGFVPFIPPGAVDRGLATIDAVATDDAATLLKDLNTLGLIGGVARGGLVSGRLPVGAITSAEALTSLQSIRLAAARASVGSVTSQADHAMRTDVGRIQFDVDGSGLSIGILSDSYDALGGEAGDISSGDLPAGVNVLSDLSGAGLIDEGRAMAQLIYDVAPGADLLFHTAFAGQADFAQGILDLQAAGADIIVDDIFYFAEPIFQDGVIAQAVDEAVDNGAVYFSAAGNSADHSYEATYEPASTVTPFIDFAIFGALSLHDFDPGPGVDNVFEFTIPAGVPMTTVLQWDQPFASSGGIGSANDVDIVLIDLDAGVILASSVSANTGGDPFEIIRGSLGADFNVGLVIAHFDDGGPTPGRIKLIEYGDASIYPSGFLDAGTVVGHANATQAIATGAAFYRDTPPFGVTPPVRESFSSKGGVLVLYDTAGNPIPADDRNQPKIVAPDGTDNTFFGGDVDGNGFPNFFGTSAAAPHAAALAALQLECDATLTPQEVRDIQMDTAVDMDAAGFDIYTGAGLVDGRAALSLLCGSVAVAQCNGLPVDVFIGNGDTPTADDDVILGTSGADIINSLSGNDTICSLGGADIINAGGGDDWVDSGAGDDEIFGGGGNDSLFAGSGDDVVIGSSGDDDIEGNAGDDMLLGQVGDDTIDGGSGVDEINGGPGSDTIFTGSGSTVGSGVSVNGGGGGDFIFGGSDADFIRGGGGADLIRGGAGNDLITGGVGRDEIYGENGNDDIRGQESIDTLNGGNGRDVITGGSARDVINGGPGDDMLTGGSGDDQINGDTGSDTILGGSDDDIMNGGASGGDSCNGQSGVDTASGGCEIIISVP